MRNSQYSTVFRTNDFIYAISGKNVYGEYVVIKMMENEHANAQIIDTRIIKARNVKRVQEIVAMHPFENFKKMPDYKMH